MSVRHAEVGTADPIGLDPAPVNIRIRISALWTAMLFVFAYVDIFSFFRPDIRAEIAAGEISGFTIGGPFLLATTAYILLPSLMVALNMFLRPGLVRSTNMVLAVVYSLTIVAGMIGEWGYYVLGSVVELVLLACIFRASRNWQRV